MRIESKDDLGVKLIGPGPLYAQPFHDTAARTAALPAFVDFDNRFRPHWSLGGQPPMSRIPPVNNLTGKNS